MEIVAPATSVKLAQPGLLTGGRAGLVQHLLLRFHLHLLH